MPIFLKVGYFCICIMITSISLLQAALPPHLALFFNFRPATPGEASPGRPVETDLLIDFHPGPQVYQPVGVPFLFEERFPFLTAGLQAFSLAPSDWARSRGEIDTFLPQDGYLERRCLESFREGMVKHGFWVVCWFILQCIKNFHFWGHNIFFLWEQINNTSSLFRNKTCFLFAVCNLLNFFDWKKKLLSLISILRQNIPPCKHDVVWISIYVLATLSISHIHKCN